MWPSGPDFTADNLKAVLGLPHRGHSIDTTFIFSSAVFRFAYTANNAYNAKFRVRVQHCAALHSSADSSPLWTVLAQICRKCDCGRADVFLNNLLAFCLAELHLIPVLRRFSYNATECCALKLPLRNLILFV